jgi:hypothetical protein
VGSEKKSSLICHKTGRTVTISTLHLECGSAAAAFVSKAVAALPHSKYFVRIRDIWTIFSHDRRDGLNQFYSTVPTEQKVCGIRRPTGSQMRIPAISESAKGRLLGWLLASNGCDARK